MSLTGRERHNTNLQFDGEYGSFGLSVPRNPSASLDSDTLKSLFANLFRNVADAPQYPKDEKDSYIDAMCTLRGSLTTGYKVEHYLNKIIAGLQPKSLTWAQSLRGMWSDRWPYGLNAQELEHLLETVKFDINYFKNNANKRNELCNKLVKVARLMNTVYSFTAEDCQQLSVFKSVAWYQQLEKDLDNYLTTLPIELPSSVKGKFTEAEKNRRIWPFEQNEKQLINFIERMGELTSFLAKKGYLIEPMVLADYKTSFPVQRQVLVADLTIYKKQLASFFSGVALLRDEKKPEKNGEQSAEHKESRRCVI